MTNTDKRSAKRKVSAKSLCDVPALEFRRAIQIQIHIQLSDITVLTQKRRKNHKKS